MREGWAYQVEEEGDPLHGPVLLKVALEEVGRLHVHSHGREHNGEVVVAAILRDQVEREARERSEEAGLPTAAL